jgi:hypothetical protein
MKKSLLTATLALVAWAAAEQRAAAWTRVDIGASCHFCFETTGHNRCLTYTSCSNPPPCGYACGPGCGPHAWDGLGAYGAGPGPGFGVAVPADGTTPPATPTLPAPTPAPAATPSGPQKAAYYTTSGGAYGYTGSYTYGYGYGGFQAPSYWYDR